MSPNLRRLQDLNACLIAAAAFMASPPVATAKTLIDYFQPMPIINRLTSSAWGAAGVLPRDQDNGLEDRTIKSWCYWDGKIIRAADGKYHLFGSRWDQSKGHSGWSGSVAVHAVSDTSPLGPYVEKGLVYSDQSGKGHNVTAATLPDGRYAIVVSETRPGDIFIASSLDGPWTPQGSIRVDANGFDATGTTSNLSLVVRPDGSYLMVSRHGIMMLSTTGILGPYKVQGPSVYPTISGLNNGNAEDPTIWYSGGQYHITVNWWDARKAYHLTSPDGIKNWKNQGLAYDPTLPFLRYTDGTVNIWNKIERPGVLIENGHVTHFTFAVIDVPKEQELGNDNHGSKIIVVPFDGVAFDTETGITGAGGGAGAGGRGGAGGGGGRGGASGATGMGGAIAGRGGTGGGGGSGGGGGVVSVDAGSGGTGGLATGEGGDGGNGGATGVGGTGPGAGGMAMAGTTGTSTGSAGTTGGSGGSAPAGASGTSGGAGVGGEAGVGEEPGAAGCACATESRSTTARGLLVALGACGLVLFKRRQCRRAR